MGLLNARNLRMAKQLLDKNRHKIGGAVEKAGTQLDKVSKGKTSNVTSKAADAAKKYSAGDVTHHGLDSPAPDLAPHGDPLAADAAKVRQNEATAKAATAVTGAANALTGFINKAAAKAESSNEKKHGGTGAAATSSDSDDIPRDQFDKG